MPLRMRRAKLRFSISRMKPAPIPASPYFPRFTGEELPATSYLK